MASVSKVILIDTKTGQRGDAGQRKTSFNQRCDDFTTFCKLEPVKKGDKVQPVKVLLETSPNGEDWDTLHTVELSEDKAVDFKDLNERHMLAHLRVSYDEQALSKVVKKDKQEIVVPTGHLHVEVCYKDLR